MGSVNPRAATHQSGHGSASHNPAKKQLPLFTVMRRFRSQVSLRATSRMVAVVIADAMGPDGLRQATFMGEKEIARRSGLSMRTVRSCLHELDKMDKPFFYRTLGGKTRGRKHRCYRFEMIESVAAFSSAARQREEADRQAAAARQRDTLERALRGL